MNKNSPSHRESLRGIAPSCEPENDIDNPNNQDNNESHEQTPEKGDGNLAQAAESLQRASGATSPQVPEGWRSRSAREARQLADWAAQNGLTAADPVPESDIDGFEHRIQFLPATQEWRKMTHPGAGYGLQPTLEYSLDPQTQQFSNYLDWREGTPLEYLVRLQIAREIFGDPVRLEGIHTTPDGEICIVIRQAHFVGDPPTIHEIAKSLGSEGFLPTGEGRFRPSDGVYIGDAHPRNLVKTPDGHIMPIDLVIAKPDGDLLAYLQEDTRSAQQSSK